MTTSVPAVVLAGGRISGWFARESGTTIKALVPVRGKPLFRWVLDALAATPEVGAVCVVGPEDLKTHLAEGEALVLEKGRVLENLRVGLTALSALASAQSRQRVLVVGADSGTVTPEALSDLLARAPSEAELCLPLVRKERFQAVFPGNLGIYVRLADGAFTSGGQGLVDPAAIERNAALLQGMFDRRKSQLAMALALGPRFVARLIAGRLSIAELEERATELTGCVCRAVPDCDPLLAFDVDNVLDARYLESWLDRRRRAS